MRGAFLIIAAAALLGGAAQAKDQPNAMAAGKDAVDGRATPKKLYVCSEDEAAWRSVSRDFGIPEFVTAKQVRADAAGGKAWAGPRCITPAQLRQLTDDEKVGELIRTSSR